METPVAQLAQGRMKKALPPTIRPLLAGSLNIQDTQPVVVALRVRSEAAITARISRGLRARQTCRAGELHAATGGGPQGQQLAGVAWSCLQQQPHTIISASTLHHTILVPLPGLT